MAKRIALAKISRPRIFGVVPRERLFELLDANITRPLLWVSGPPGAGKTSLIASYLAERGQATVWYQVDAGDLDAASVFHYLSLSLQTVSQASAAELPRFASEHLHNIEAFARIFFRALYAALPEGCVLVFDNCQEVAADSALDRILLQAATQAPPQSSVIAISRMAASSSLSGLAVSGSMAAIGWADLRLSIDEVRAIALQRNVTDARTVDAVYEQSQGWAAGVTLMLERNATAGALTEIRVAEGREALFAYLATLLFEGATDSTRKALLSAAFLPYVTASMVAALSGQTDSGVILEYLYRRHLFTDRRPGEESVYQFHALLREFLQARTRATGVDVEQLMVRSGEVLKAHGDIQAALQLFCAAAHWDAAIALILSNANALLASGRRETLERWITALPSTRLRQFPWLLYWLGQAQVQTNPTNAIKTLREALALFKEAQDNEAQVLCLAALLNAAFLGFIALDAMDEWLDDLLGRLSAAVPFSSTDIELRVWGVLCSALFWLRPWHPWTEHAAQRVEALLARSEDPNLALAAASSALATTTFNGQFECGDRIAASTAHLVESPMASPTQAAWWLVQTGWLRFFEARYSEALELIGRGGRIASSNGTHKSFLMGVLHRCAVEFRVLGWGIAGATLADTELMLPDSRYPMAEAMLLLLQARRAQFRGQQCTVADLAEQAESVTARIGSRYQEMLFGLINAELFLHAGRMERARTVLARSKAVIERAPALDCWRAALSFVEAMLAHVEGDRPLAIGTLSKALALAKAGKRRYYLRHFECAMPPLFALALRENLEVEFVQAMIRLFRIRPPADVPANWPWAVQVYTLGRFEVLVDGKPLEYLRKTPRKTLLLLKAIVALGGHDVPEQALCDALWGDEEGDAASNALSTSLLRLRKLLGSSDAVVQRNGSISLNSELCWVDVHAFEKSVGGLCKPSWDTLSIYRGAFLSGDLEEPWTVAARERVRGRFINAAASCGTELEATGQYHMALECYLRGIDSDPIVESFYVGLMRCYLRLGRHSEAASAYRRLRQTLSVVLGVQPSDDTQRLFESFLSSRPLVPSTGPSSASESGAVRKLHNRSR